MPTLRPLISLVRELAATILQDIAQYMNHAFASPLPNRPLHALVVDDDPFMLELIGAMLRDLGVENISVASDGKKGFSAFSAATVAPDLVICDINMPNTDGFQLMELLADRHSGCALILMSGLDERFVNSAALMAKFHHLNMVGTLRKPVQRDALAGLLAKLPRAGYG